MQAEDLCTGNYFVIQRFYTVGVELYADLRTVGVLRGSSMYGRSLCGANGYPL